jgi:hypothetical protein
VFDPSAAAAADNCQGLLLPGNTLFLLQKSDTAASNYVSNTQHMSNMACHSGQLVVCSADSTPHTGAYVFAAYSLCCFVDCCVVPT